MDRFLALWDRHSRTTSTLSLLWTLQFPLVRAYLQRVGLAGLVCVAVVLNFGLDLEDARQRRRQLVPGASRMLLVALVLAIWRSRARPRLFLMGCVLRFWPLASFRLLAAVRAAAERVRGPHALLASDGSCARRFGDATNCAICLEDEAGWNTQCGHLYHRQCLEQWVRCSPHCPVCKAAIAVRPDLLADLLGFSESKWLRQHALLGALYWTR